MGHRRQISLVLGLALLQAFSGGAPLLADDAPLPGAGDSSVKEDSKAPTTSGSADTGTGDSQGKSQSGSQNSQGPENKPNTAPAAPKTLEMRLSGSTCTACLLELEKRLKQIPGVLKAKVDYPVENYYGYYQAPPASAAAKATITFDTARVSFADIQSLLKVQGYHPFKIVERNR